VWRPPIQPSVVPKGVANIIDDGPSFAFAGPAGSTINVPFSLGDGPGVVGSVGRMAVLPPPSRPPDPVVKPVEPVTKRIIQTSQLDQAQILHRVDPVYPELGKRMRVSGTVELRGIIGTDGRIRSLQVLSGHPLLVKAAVDAVSQWIYKPTRLSGQSVEVDAPISVVFRLN
jgi:protein TonB